MGSGRVAAWTAAPGSGPAGERHVGLPATGRQRCRELGPEPGGESVPRRPGEETGSRWGVGRARSISTG